MDHQGAVARGSARHLRGSDLGAAAARRTRVSGSAGVRAGGDRPHPHERADGGSPRRPADGDPGHLRAGVGPERRQLRDEGDEQRARGQPVHERLERPLGPVAGDLGDRVPELRRHRGGRGDPVRHRSERAPARELPPGVAPGDARSRRPDLSRLRRDRERDAVRERRLRPGSADRVRPGGRGLSRRAGQRRGRPDRRGLRGDRAADVHVRDPGRHAAGGGGGGGGAARAAGDRVPADGVGVLDPGLHRLRRGELEVHQPFGARSGLGRDRVPRRHGLRAGRQVELLQRRLRRAAVSVRSVRDPDARRGLSQGAQGELPAGAGRGPRLGAVSAHEDHGAGVIGGVRRRGRSQDDGGAGRGARLGAVSAHADHGAGVLGGGRRRGRSQDDGGAALPAHRPHDRSDGGERSAQGRVPGVPLVPERAALRPGRQPHDRPAALRVHDEHGEHRERSGDAGAERVHQRAAGGPEERLLGVGVDRAVVALGTAGGAGGDGGDRGADGRLEDGARVLGGVPVEGQPVQDRPGDGGGDLGGGERGGTDREVSGAGQRDRGAAGVRGGVGGGVRGAARDRGGAGFPGPGDAVPAACGPDGADPGLRGARSGAAVRGLDTCCEAHDPAPRFVDSQHVSWFDFDCDYCTGVFNQQKGGLFHHTWLAESPPPSPGTNLGVSYNYTDNPDRRFAPGGDGQVTIAWDNLSEVTADPKTAWFDFRGYKIWKVSNWTRPVGSGGPGEDDWTLLAEYRLFDYAPNNKYKIVTTAGDTVIKCPRVYIPQVGDSMDICLDRGDLWDRQSGNIIKPNPSVLCVGYPNCVIDSAFANGTKTVRPNEGRIHYPVGRYAHVDRQVKNGFLYFYSVSAFDSTGFGGGKVELNGRRAAVEAEGVVPQSGTNLNRGVWVVPNPYRGLRAIQDRPSAWDLTPNASDPTGTHIDFLGLPGGKWSIKIFTLSGDLVVTLSSDDAVNASTRNSTVIDSRGVGHQNVTRQQDTPNDGQARWNLISRNGQDVVSGIYLFTVESTRGTQRGKFVIIR